MYKYLIVFFLFIVSLSTKIDAKSVNLNLLEDVSALIKEKDYYTDLKEAKIQEIRSMFNTPNLTSLQLYDLNLQLYNEYSTYISDSAIIYAKKISEIAFEIDDVVRKEQSTLLLSSSFTIAGMYIDALELLNTIDVDDLPEFLKVQYFDCYKQLYKFYSSGSIHARLYNEKSAIYRDSLLMVLDPNSNHYKIVYADKLQETGNPDRALAILSELYELSTQDDHERAVLAYSLAVVYREKGDVEKQKQYLALSAMSDIKNAIKENAAMSALSVVLYKQGKIDDAYLCIKSSMEDAMFCNARLRSYEVSNIFPIIELAYKDKVSKQNDQLQYFLIGVTILSVFLTLMTVYVYKQMKRISRIRKTLYRTNVQLSQLNNDLKDSNKLLSKVNIELKEANRIKETYIGHFLDLCSAYINKLETYQSMLNQKARDKKLDELYKILRSNKMIENELLELLNRFDNIFLQLYPHFVHDFNLLLVEEERFMLGPNEMLNTELRIFALIRLGIKDSARIANFLHYSPNTIYNYRTRTRNKAISRDDFEEKVIKIGSFSK